jgi:hypothetical protein
VKQACLNHFLYALFGNADGRGGSIPVGPEIMAFPVPRAKVRFRQCQGALHRNRLMQERKFKSGRIAREQQDSHFLLGHRQAVQPGNAECPAGGKGGNPARAVVAVGVFLPPAPARPERSEPGIAGYRPPVDGFGADKKHRFMIFLPFRFQPGVIGSLLVFGEHVARRMSVGYQKIRTPGRPLRHSRLFRSDESDAVIVYVIINQAAVQNRQDAILQPTPAVHGHALTPSGCEEVMQGLIPGFGEVQKFCRISRGDDLGILRHIVPAERQFENPHIPPESQPCRSGLLPGARSCPYVSFFGFRFNGLQLGLELPRADFGFDFAIVSQVIGPGYRHPVFRHQHRISGMHIAQ